VRKHHETHAATRGGWLRAAVLGANDGLISTASLVMGVSAAALSDSAVMTAGLAGLVGGALSMAAGEYVSVSSQADSQLADLERERRELQTAPEAEHQELIGMFVQRGLSRATAELVAGEYEQHDLLAVHARMELGITDLTRARPLAAALSSMAAFTAGALVPLLLFQLLPAAQRAALMLVASVALLMVLGAMAARLGGAPLLRPALRVGAFGLLAMAATMFIGRLLGVTP
jgi:VIT1/CCC1 family predicted Fe2+/Mn2+ transporter